MRILGCGGPSAMAASLKQALPSIIMLRTAQSRLQSPLLSCLKRRNHGTVCCSIGFTNHTVSSVVRPFASHLSRMPLPTCCERHESHGLSLSLFLTTISPPIQTHCYCAAATRAFLELSPQADREKNCSPWRWIHRINGGVSGLWIS